MTDYRELNANLRALIEGVPHLIADLANASALLWERLPDLNWAGFYLMTECPPNGHPTTDNHSTTEYQSMADSHPKTDSRPKADSHPATEYRLVLGPFQGKAACVEIPVGKGVCGTAVKENRTQLVPNVHEFPGHIACDGASNAEIVVPIRKNGEVWGVLDLDSPTLGRFTEEDRDGLEAFVRVLEDCLFAE